MLERVKSAHLLMDEQPTVLSLALNSSSTMAMAVISPLFFVSTNEARIRANTQNINNGSRRQNKRKREGQNIVEQRHEEICGRESDGAGYTG